MAAVVRGRQPKKGRQEPAVKKAARKKAAKKAAKKDIPAAYDRYKTYEGKQYTGMKVGRSHKWTYDAGSWTETKITPDLWQISYAVTKRRKGHAPGGLAYRWVRNTIGTS